MESSGPQGDCVSPVVGGREGEGRWWIGVKWAAGGLCKSCHEACNQHIINCVYYIVWMMGRRKGEGGRKREREGEREREKRRGRKGEGRREST